MGEVLPFQGRGIEPPPPVTCEWCRAAPSAHTIALSSGRKVKAGWRGGLSIRVCSKCRKTIERNRGTEA